MAKKKSLKEKLVEQDARYRANIRNSSNRHVAAESKMLDAQHEAEQQVLLSRRNRAKKRIMRPGSAEDGY